MKFIFANGDSAFTKFNFVGRLDFSICAWGNTFDKREKLKTSIISKISGSNAG